MKKSLRFLVFLFLVPLALQGQVVLRRPVDYRINDWVTYEVSRFVRAVTFGWDEAYFGTTGGVIRYDFNRREWGEPYTVSSGLPDDEVTALAYDIGTSILWVATATGLSYLDPAADEFRVFDNTSLGGEVEAIGPGRDHLWLRLQGRVLRGDRRGGFFVDATPQEAADDQAQWQGGPPPQGTLPELYPDGDYHYFSSGYLQDYALRKYRITSAVRDDHEQLWIGTWGQGGGLADLRSQRLELFSYGPWVQEVRALCWSDQGLWMGGQNPGHRPGGVTHWDWDLDQWKTLEAFRIARLHSDRVYSLVEDGQTTWIGTDAGLAAYELDRDRWRSWSVRDNLWDNVILHLALGDAGLWVATDAGLNLMDPASGAVTQIRDSRLIHRPVFWVETEGAEVWIGTDRGLFHQADTAAPWEYLQPPVNMPARDITALSVNGDELWVGTELGIMVLDRVTGAWTTYPTPHWPTEGYVHTLLADSAAVWAGTDRGLLKWVRGENRWRRFTTADGLPDDRIFAILINGDDLWLGTGKGLCRFYWNAPYRID